MSTALSDYDYPLPDSAIAQSPAEPRDSSRLMHLAHDGSPIGHRVFRDLPDLLRPGDLLVLNDTRVVPARLLGRRELTGGRWEGLVLAEVAPGLWDMLTQTGGRPTAGEVILVDAPSDESNLRIELVASLGAGRWHVRPLEAGTMTELLDRFGHIPLPRYIRKGQDTPEDRTRYQTVYAAHAGSVAAPTAGLHFTPAVLNALDAAGIARAFVTLHVGIGTFQPITAEDVRDHVMHSEFAEVPAATVEAVVRCKARGGRVIAVGTTTVRTLENAARDGTLTTKSGPTDLFIRPGHEFRVVEGIVTNFHLPKSSLLLLVAARIGREPMLAAYRTAIEMGYRFFSYGDAMLIEP